MPFRSEKQRLAFEALRPQTVFYEIVYRTDYAEVGELYQHRRLGIELQISGSFYGPDDGLLYLEGFVVRCRKGTGFQVGSIWACQASKLLKVS